MVLETKKSESELIYENLLNLRICEILYLQINKTNYYTFSALCSNLRDSLVNNIAVKGDLAKLMIATVKNLKVTYGLSEDEAVLHIINFLSEDMWETYQEPVRIFYEDTRASFL